MIKYKFLEYFVYAIFKIRMLRRYKGVADWLTHLLTGEKCTWYLRCLTSD